MDIGMLWIDDGEKWASPTSLRESRAFSTGTIDSQNEDYVKRARQTLASRVQEAAASYEAQYGVPPSQCAAECGCPLVRPQTGGIDRAQQGPPQCLICSLAR